MTTTEPNSLSDLLDSLEAAADTDTVTVQGVLDEIGDRSITPIVLAISLILVSPLSGIPGLPTLSAAVILLVMAQALVPNRHLWLPAFLRNRSLRADRLQKAVDRMRRPAAWIDRQSAVRCAGPIFA